MSLSEEMFDDLEEREQFQNFIDITRKKNTTDNPQERYLCEQMIDNFYGRFMELLSINLHEGNEWVFLQFYEETH